VATNVGDSAAILGETGLVVPPRASKALADAWEQLLTVTPDVRERLSWAARRRILDRYGLAAIAARYEDLYENLVRPRRPSATRSRIAPKAKNRMSLNAAHGNGEGPP
jgi:glycosyltransferase involved in cell wall biosynthesis